MKNFFIAFVFVLASLASQAQAQKRSFVAFSLLAPTPIGHYKSTDFESDNALFAKGGMGFGIEGAYMIHPYVGIGAMVAGISNKFEESEFSKGVKRKYHNDGYLVNATTTGGSHWVQAYMLGVHGSYPIKGVSFDVKVLGGPVSYQFPNVQVNLSSGGAVIDVEMSADKVTNWGINAGIGARVKLTQHLAIRATVDYLQSKADVNVFQSGLQNGKVIATGQETISSAISMVNFGIGLAYQINNEK